MQRDIDALRSHVYDLELNSDSQHREIEALKYMRSQREAKKTSSQIMDWEQQLADFAANPENFKEN